MKMQDGLKAGRSIYKMKILPFLGWLVLVTALSLMPADAESLSMFPHADKLAHSLFYLGFTFLLGWGVKMSKWKLILSGTLYGILMEILQEWMGWGRIFDMFDILANIIGALIGTIILISVSK